MINSDDLRFFSVLAAHPSLAAAARSLNVTPPSVTQRLQSLEDKLQMKLLDRKTRSVTLTDEGSLLLERARVILADMDDLLEVIASKKSEVSGRLRVQAPLGFGNEHIAPLVAEFQRMHPNVSIELELSDNPDWSMGHFLDLLIHIGKPRDSSLKMTRLSANRRILCASPTYLDRFGHPDTPNELRNHHCIALKENSEDVTMWRFRNKRSGEYSSVRIVPRLLSNDGRVTKHWALQSNGIIVRSEWDVAGALKSGELVELLPQYGLPDADIVALVGTEPRHRSARTVGFLQLLKERLGNSGW